MATRVDLAELGDRDGGVNLRGVEALVAEELLDEADVGAVLQHVRGARVAEQMARAHARHADGHERAAHERPEVARAQAFAVARQKQPVLARARLQPRPALGEVALDPVRGVAAERHDAILAALALAHPDGAERAVEIGHVEPRQLGAAQAGGVERFEDRAVAHAEGIAHVGHGEERGDFLERERARERALRFSRQFQIGGGVARQKIFAAQPRKEVLHGVEPRALRDDRQRFSPAPGRW